MSRHYYTIVLVMFVLNWGTAVAQSPNKQLTKEISSLFENKARESFQKCDFTKAISLVESALIVDREYNDSIDYEYARRISDLAYYHYRLDNYDKAFELEFKALSIRQKNETTRPCDLAISYYHLCDFYGDKGDYDKAIYYGKQAVSILKKDHDALGIYLQALASLGCNSIYAGDFSLAKESIETGLELCSNNNMTESLIEGLLFTHLGMMYTASGDFYSALHYTEKGSNILKKEAGDKHDYYAYALNNLGIIYYHLGDYTSSIESLKRSVEIRKDIFGIAHQYYIRALANLGSIYEFAGDVSRATHITNQAIVLDELQLGSNSLEYCYELTDVARQKDLLGEYALAVEYQSQVVSLEARIIGPAHYDYALSLLRLADYLSNAGELERAKATAKEGFSIINQSLGENNYYNSRFYKSFARYSFLTGDTDEAMFQIEKALSTIEQLNGIKTTEYNEALFDKIKIEEARGTLNVRDIDSYNRFLQETIIHSFGNMSSFERARFWQNNNEWFTRMIPNYAILAHNDTLNCQLYNNTLLTKGITLNTGIELNKKLLNSGNETIINDYTELSRTNQQINALLSLPIIERYASVDSLIKKRELLEKALIQNSKAYGEYMKGLETTWEDIAIFLQKEDVAIEFITVPSPEGTVYYALIISSDCQAPKLVRLFHESNLERIPSKMYYSSHELYDLVWEPLEKHLKGIKRVYFAPSGKLHGIAIEYVMAKDDRKRINDEYCFYRVSTTREIINSKPYINNRSMVLFGGIEFDSDASFRADEQSAMEYTIVNDSIRSGFSYLPATMSECQGIRELMSSKYNTKFYSGLEATEARFKELSGKSVGIVHIATHGFYWSDEDITHNHKEYGFLFDSTDSQISEEQRSMSHSGLLFSGANNTLQSGTISYSGDDGVLTSIEIVDMNLNNVELLVMSACQTGLGDINSDEVFGLQRGFKASGVHTIVMSLWEVDDNATSLLMYKFYENYSKGLSASESLQKAQRYVKNYKGRITINGKRINVDYSDPKYWASFIVLDGIPRK